jgi:ATP-dependent Zn protease
VDDALRGTAYHEAGQAVAAFALRRGFHSVSIDADADTLGRMTHRRPFARGTNLDARSPTPAQEAAIRDRVVISLAGSVAEARMQGKLTRAIQRGASTDYRHAVDLATRAVEDDELETYLAWLDVRTRGLVEQWWLQVEALAAALLEHRTIGRGRGVVASVCRASRCRARGESWGRPTCSCGLRVALSPGIQQLADVLL